MQGLLLVDKPAGWTSFDVVNYIRKFARQAALVESYKVHKAESEKLGQILDFPTFQLATRLPKVKVGHTGTLDPFATGLLVILVGKEYTKKAGELSKLDKTYELTMELGVTSTTGDPEGEITKVSNEVPSIESIQGAVDKFKGEISQIPPAYSAIKINGQRAYKLAREGKTVVIEPRQITINSLQITDYKYPYVKLVADVTSGTYIRTLTEDIGKVLGTGAYTTQLRRILVDKFSIKDARNVDDINSENLEVALNTF